MFDKYTFLPLLKTKTPFSFVKFGDGEFYCMDKSSGGNCDDHPYTPELGDLLIDAYKFLCSHSNVYVGQWHDNENLVIQHESQFNVHPEKRTEYMTLLLYPQNVDIVEFYEVIRNDTRRKVFVGPTRLQEAAIMLRAEFVDFPLINGFTKFHEIKQYLIDTLTSDTIYMFCTGMNTEPFIAALLKVDQSLTCFDFGSAMDPIFVDIPTRWGCMPQITHETARVWFKNMLKKINVIIFTKDRAAQLDALLSSIQKNASWLWPPTILYAASNEDFERGYRLIEDKYNIKLIWQLPLKEKVLEAIDPSVSLTTWLVDDDIFYRTFDEITEVPYNTTFSPRLGKNSTYSYVVDKQQHEGELDFLYYFSIDGHIYRTEEIVPRVQIASFNTPNEFEDMLSRIVPMNILYNSHSCLVGIPHNRVGEYDNRHEGGSVKELNERF
jgi:hypothetical protein